MATRYISGSLVAVDTPARSIRYTDGTKHGVTVRYVTPTKAPITADQRRANTYKNEGFRAHSDLVAKLYR